MSKPRKSGIELLGDIPWGSHLCLFYETKQDLLDALLPFFKAGLENNEFIVWVISGPHFASAEEATTELQQVVPGLRQLLEKGQIEILSAPDWYLRGEELNNIEEIIKTWNDKLRGALARGYDGMRASGDMFWLGQKYWTDFYTYEKYLHDFLAGLPAMILCTYPLPKFGGGEVLDIVQAHQFGIVRRHGKWELIESPELIQAGGKIKTVGEELEGGEEQPPQSRVMYYLAAVLSVAVTLILARTLTETLGVTLPVSLLLCAIIFSAWYGGVKPGLVALALAMIAFKFYLVGPVDSWKIDAKEVPRFIVFAISSLFVVLLIGAQKTVTGSLRRALAVLDSTIRKLRETNGALRLQITERRQAEDQLRLAYQRLSYHVENTPLAVIEFDKDLTITRWSGRAEEIFGWKASEVLGKNVYDPDFRIIYEEDKKEVDKINEELTKGTVDRNLSHNRNYTRSGQVIDSEWHNSVLRDEEGNVLTIMSLVHDVTERKKTEQILNRSYEEIRQLTSHLQNIREEERSHIAREIHDELGQQLTVLKMDVLGLSKKLGDPDAVIQEKIRDITDLLDSTVRSVRRISSELRPSLLYNLGLDAAIEWHLKEFGKRSGLKTIFIEPAGEVKIPDPVKNGLFRIFQESLTNVSRHAKATKVIVSLEQRDGRLTLTIEDDGQGFEQERIGAKQTLGILGMRERCEMMGGEYTIQSAPGQGTTVAVAVPYDDNKRPQ